MSPLPHAHSDPAALAPVIRALERQEDFQAAAELLRQLGDPTRLRLFWLLCHCEECVINISALLEMTSPAVSHHLRQLKDSGLIVSRRAGKEVYYRAADSRQAQALHRIAEEVMALGCPGEEVL